MALDDELIDRSPLERIKSQKHQKREPDPFDREETERILTYMHERYDEQVWNWYEFAFGTGMRPSEQIVVQWRDVDWKRQSIRVERARVRAVEKSTKTRTVRDVDLTPRMMAVLRRQKAHSFMRGLDSPIFINPVTNTPWPDVQDQRKLYFHPALRALGIRSRDAYQTRHTYATTALMGGVNPAYIARQLGHKSAAMLFRHYSKWIDHADYGREAAKLNQIYGS
jgi:integrase